MKKNNRSLIIFSCGVQKCCPSVRMSKNKISVKDDNGNKVTMTRKQWEDLIHAYFKNK